MSEYSMAIFEYMIDELDIDPDREDIDWYIDSEPLHYYVVRFEVDGEEYTLRYDKLNGEVERVD